ncbi:MAG: hypothetical protein WD378_00060 [Egicoccus sp.]
MRLRNTTAAAAVAVLLAACGGDDDGDPGATSETEPETAESIEEEDSDGEDAGDDAGGETLGDLELPDPDEFISDGEFRGQGIILPIPDGWSVDQMALLQGLVAASADDDQTQQLVAQAIDTTQLGEDQQISFDELIEVQRTQFDPIDPDLEPSVDEEVEIDGATAAHRLRFEDVQIEEQPAFDLELVLAEDGEGRIALFNYAAPTDSFDDAIAEQMVDGVGIDPDSEPPEPQVPAAPQGGAGEGGDEPIPVEPDEGIGDGAGPPEDDAEADTDG